MSLFAAPITPPKYRAFDSNGAPLANGKVYTYKAGTSLPLATYPTYADAIAGSNANANPVILDANGEAPIWGAVGVYAYKIVLKDSTDAIQNTFDSVYVGQAYPTPIPSEWVLDTNTVTQLSSTSFTVSGVDVTSTYHVGRRIKTTNTGGTVYSTVRSSSFATDTTVNVINDGAGVLDAGLSALYYGWASYSNPSYLDPRTYVAVYKNGDMTGFGSATKVTAWTEDLDSLSEFATPTFTTKYTGKYLVLVEADISDTGTNVAVTLSIYKNGSPVRDSVSRTSATAGQIWNYTAIWMGTLAFTDTIEVYVTGSANTTVKGTNTRWSIIRIA